MTILFTEEDLEEIKPGENEAVLTDIKEVTDEDNGDQKIKFYFRIKDETLVETCYRYLKKKKDGSYSRLRKFLESMTGTEIEKLVKNDFNPESLKGNKYLVTVEQNKGQSRTFNNITEIKHQIEDESQQSAIDEDDIFNQ